MATMTFERHDGRASQRLDVDAAVVAAAQHDPRAFAPLYEKYFDGIYGYCLRSLRDRELAADAASQTFAKALKALPRYRAWSFRSWLFAIAHNVIVDTVRRRKPTLSLEIAASVIDREPNPEEQLLASESQQRVAAALAHLTEEQRQVVQLRMAGLNGNEIAEVLDTTTGAVKAMQFRAYRRLRTLLTVDSEHIEKERRDVRQ